MTKRIPLLCWTNLMTVLVHKCIQGWNHNRHCFQRILRLSIFMQKELQSLSFTVMWLSLAPRLLAQSDSIRFSPFLIIEQQGKIATNRSRTRCSPVSWLHVSLTDHDKWLDGPYLLFQHLQRKIWSMINICLGCAAEPDVDLHNSHQGDGKHGNDFYSRATVRFRGRQEI